MSLIVRPRREPPVIRTLTSTAILAALTLPMGCGGARPTERSSPAADVQTPGSVGEPSSPPHPEPSGLPDPESYAAQMDARERFWWQQPQKVVDMLRCAPGMTVVDLGAGTGYFLPFLARAVGRNGRVLALDASRAMVERLFERVARERLRNVKPVVVPFDDPSLTPRSADRVLVVNTWHHLPNRIEYAERLRSALRTGGEVLVVDFEMDSPRGPPPEHRLEPLRVADELEAAGFAVSRLSETLPYQFVIRGVVR